MDIKDNLILVTGGGSGLGAETAKQFSALGAKVVILDANEEKAASVAKAIQGFSIKVDVADSHSVENAFQVIKEKWGIPRVCINCAGILGAARVVGKKGPVNLDDFRLVIEVNLIGTFNVLRMAAAEMINHKPINETGERGVIINTASIAAFEGQLGQSAYSASKAGIVGMTLPIARELADFGIRIMTIAPGLMETPMLEGLKESIKKNLEASTLFPHRLGKPEEFAKLAIHIVENPLLNGSVIRLDGGVRLS